MEVQDESSQLVAALARPRPANRFSISAPAAAARRSPVAATMDNRGQIFATDSDGRRLMPIYERLERAGVRNVQVRAPKGDKGYSRRSGWAVRSRPRRCARAGVGTWRRNPDAKWRMRPGALEQRMKDQDRVLERAAKYVKPGGRLVYVTCSLLDEENGDRVAAFLAAHPEFATRDMAEAARGGLEAILPVATRGAWPDARPSKIGADGFCVCALTKS